MGYAGFTGIKNFASGVAGVGAIAYSFTPTVDTLVNRVKFRTETTGSGKVLNIGIASSLGAPASATTFIASISVTINSTTDYNLPFPPTLLTAGVTYYLVCITNVSSDNRSLSKTTDLTVDNCTLVHWGYTAATPAGNFGAPGDGTNGVCASVYSDGTGYGAVTGYQGLTGETADVSRVSLDIHDAYTFVPTAPTYVTHMEAWMSGGGVGTYTVGITDGVQVPNAIVWLCKATLNGQAGVGFLDRQPVDTPVLLAAGHTYNIVCLRASGVQSVQGTTAPAWTNGANVDGLCRFSTTIGSSWSSRSIAASAPAARIYSSGEGYITTYIPTTPYLIDQLMKFYAERVGPTIVALRKPVTLADWEYCWLLDNGGSATLSNADNQLVLLGRCTSPMLPTNFTAVVP